jgi:hypothetical protein
VPVHVVVLDVGGSQSVAPAMLLQSKHLICALAIDTVIAKTTNRAQAVIDDDILQAAVACT